MAEAEKLNNFLCEDTTLMEERVRLSIIIWIKPRFGIR